MSEQILKSVLLFGVLSCLSASAEEKAPELKIPPVTDRPIEGETNTVEPKAAAVPDKPPEAAPANSPVSDATPPSENVAADSDGGTVSVGIVPEPFPVSRYASLWENSPFQIESIAPPQQSESMAQRFVLGGILRENGEPVIWVRERATQQSYKVTRNATNNLGLSLVEVDESMSRQSEASATVRMANEQGVIKFDAASASVAPNTGMAPPAPPMPLRAPMAAAPVPGQAIPHTATANVQPNAANPATVQPGAVPPVPGPAAPPAAQMQATAQEQMPPPRVIRRRAIIPSAPSAP